MSKQHYLDLALHKRCSWIPSQFCSCHGWGMPPTDCGTPCLIHHCQAVINTLETVVRTDIVDSVVLCMFSKFDCSSVCCQWSVPCSFESMCNWLLCPCLVGMYMFSSACLISYHYDQCGCQLVCAHIVKHGYKCFVNNLLALLYQSFHASNLPSKLENFSTRHGQFGRFQLIY